MLLDGNGDRLPEVETVIGEFQAVTGGAQAVRCGDHKPDWALFPEITLQGSDQVVGPQTESRSGIWQGESENCLQKPIVRISTHEWESLAVIERSVTLIGRFVRERPPLEAIRASIGASLHLEGEVQIGSLNRRTILMRFTLEADCRRTWLRSQAMVEGSRVWFSRWTPEWKADRDSPLAMVWLSLPNLPQHLFNLHMISRVCAPIRRVVMLDAATIRRTRPNVAKATVEIDVSKPLVEEVWIEIDGGNGNLGGFGQRIDFEKVPMYCSCCGRFGHLEAMCRRRLGKGAEVAGPLEPREVVGDRHPEPVVDLQCDQVAYPQRGEGEDGVIGPGLVEVGQAQQGVSSASISVSFNEWAEKLKAQMGHDHELVKIVEEAKQEVMAFFEQAYKDLGQLGYEEAEDLVHKATTIFVGKIAAQRQCEGSSNNASGPAGLINIEIGTNIGSKGAVEVELHETQAGLEITQASYTGNSMAVREMDQQKNNKIVGDESVGSSSKEAVVKNQEGGPVDSNKEVDGPARNESCCSNTIVGSIESMETPSVSKKKPKWKENWDKVNVKEWCEEVDKEFDEDEEFARIVLETMGEVKAIAKKKIWKNGDEDYDVPSMEEAVKIMIII